MPLIPFAESDFDADRGEFVWPINPSIDANFWDDAPGRGYRWRPPAPWALVFMTAGHPMDFQRWRIGADPRFFHRRNESEDLHRPGIQGMDRAAAVRQAFAALGGMKAFVKPGERVLLKVNAAFASPPALGATSHPDLVAAVVRLCLDAGASRVTVTDNPINDPASCFALTGIDAAARRAGAEVVIPRESLFRRHTALPAAA
jgi:hypothetical protein